MSHDDEAELIRKHWPIAMKAARNLRAIGVSRDELTSDAQLAMLESIRAYDATRGASLPTFLYRQVRWRMLDMLRSRGLTDRKDRPRRKVAQQLEMEELLPDTRAASESVDGREYFDWLVQPLTPLQRAVVVGHYRDCRTLTDIGADIGRSKCRCSQLLHDALEVLRYRLGAQQSA